ncbi:MAG: hypothetical protein LLG24_06530 [Actinomycetia bacterium]|nr:hypothetical protein [Actinomycetes bacterium]
MIISDEQVHRVVEYLHTAKEQTGGERPLIRCDVPGELVARVVREVNGLPDVRGDRVEQARAALAFDPPAPDEVATKLIGRVLSDSLR